MAIGNRLSKRRLARRQARNRGWKKRPHCWMEQPLLAADWWACMGLKEARDVGTDRICCRKLSLRGCSGCCHLYTLLLLLLLVRDCVLRQIVDLGRVVLQQVGAGSGVQVGRHAWHLMATHDLPLGLRGPALPWLHHPLSTCVWHNLGGCFFLKGLRPATLT